jgi:hypothetical protein
VLIPINDGSTVVAACTSNVGAITVHAIPLAQTASISL